MPCSLRRRMLIRSTQKPVRSSSNIQGIFMVVRDLVLPDEQVSWGSGDRKWKTCLHLLDLRFESAGYFCCSLPTLYSVAITSGTICTGVSAHARTLI